MGLGGSGNERKNGGGKRDDKNFNGGMLQYFGKRPDVLSIFPHYCVVIPKLISTIILCLFISELNYNADIVYLLFVRPLLLLMHCVTHCSLRDRNGFPCNASRLDEVPSLVAPGFQKEPKACIVQTQTLLFSCTGTSPTVMRLCPCRKFKKGQVALCDGC